MSYGKVKTVFGQPLFKHGKKLKLGCILKTTMAQKHHAFQGKCQLDNLVQYLHDLVKAKFMQDPILAVVLFFNSQVTQKNPHGPNTMIYPESHSARQ